MQLWEVLEVHPLSKWGICVLGGGGVCVILACVTGVFVCGCACDLGMCVSVTVVCVCDVCVTLVCVYHVCVCV